MPLVVVPSRANRRRRRPSRAIVALAALAVAAGCIRIDTKGYPVVERTDVTALVTTGSAAAGAGAGGADTVWTLARPPFTVVGRRRATIELPTGLTGVVRGWERIFGQPPGPATVVLQEVPERGKAAPAPIALPDSLAARPVVWVPTVRWDEDREQRMGMPGQGAMPAPPARFAGGAARQLAQLWLDERLGKEGFTALPPWLRAGLVEVLGGLEASMMPPRRRGGGSGVPRVALDSLLAQRCPDGWSPAPAWKPAAQPAPDSARGDRREPSRGDRQRMMEESLRDPCGPALRLSSASFLRYLMDRGGDRLGESLVREYQRGGNVEGVVRGQPGLPSTVAELDRAWRAWEQQRASDEMRRPGM